MADQKISALSSGAPAQAGDEYVVARSGSNYKLTLTNIAANMPATTVASGNLTFSGTGQRITGDMSNATATSRLAFQSSTTNGNTILQAIPNGTATQTNLLLYANTDLDNTAALNIFQNATESTVRAIALGTGSYTPLTFYTGGSERMRIDSSGNVGIGGTADASAKINTLGTLPTSGGETNIFLAAGTIPSGSTTGANVFRSNPSTAAASFTLPYLTHFWATPQTFGAGSTVTNQYGFLVGSSLTGATNNFGFYSNIASGSNRWNFYANGTADNYLANNLKIGGTADRATTAGTNQLVLFNGTAPVGTLANGVSFYSASGEARVMDAAGNSTLLSPHDQATNEWIFHSKHTPSGKVLRIDVEKMLRFINEHFDLDMVQEWTE